MNFLQRPLAFAFALSLSLAANAPARAQEVDDIAIQPVRKGARVLRPIDETPVVSRTVAKPSPSATPAVNNASTTTTAPSGAAAPAAPAAALGITHMSNPCAEGETWKFADNAPFVAEIRQNLSEANPARALLAAVRVKNDFGKYWAARAFMNLKFNFLSYSLFSDLFRSTVDLKVKQAALTCMAKVHNRMPSLELPKAANWAGLSITDNEALLTLLMQNPAEDNVAASKLGQPHIFFYKALHAHAIHAPGEEVRNLNLFLEHRGADAFLARFADDARFMLARAYFTNGNYAESLAAYKVMNHAGNTQVDVLNEMGWPFLKANQLPQTVGLMQQLRVGTLRPLFAPEPYLAAAIATLQLCLYPEMSQIYSTFKQDYRAAFEWLQANKSNQDLYHEVILSLSNRSKAPAKVSLEWVRSSMFLTRQSDINQLAKEEKDFNSLMARMSLPAMNDFKQLFVREVVVFRTKLVQMIHSGLAKKNQKMLDTLMSIHKTLGDLEKRIYLQSATDRMALVAPSKADNKAQEAMEERKKAENLAPEDVWSWGRLPASEASNAEIWDDEVGTAFRINLIDKCKNKGKFLNAPVKR